MGLKIKIDFDKAITKVLENIRKAATDKAELDTIAVETAEQIRKRTRLGFGVEDNGKNQKKLKDVSESYSNYRKGIVKFKAKKSGKNKIVSFKISPPKLLHGDAASGRKSNLTATGQLTDAITGSAPSAGTIKITITPNNRKGVDIYGKRVKGEPTNREIVELQEDQDRPFLYLTQAELSSIERKIRDIVLSKLTKK